MQISERITASAPRSCCAPPARAHLLPAGADHRLVAFEAFAHLHQAVETLAQAHFALLDAAVHHQVDQQLLAHRHHRLLRNHHCLGALGEDHRDADELAGAQTAVVVADMGADRLAAADFVQTRVDGEDLALEALARIGVQADFHRLPQAYLGHGLLRDAEVDLQRVEHFQVDDVLPGAEVVADAGLAQAERAIVGRLDLGLVEPRLGQRLTGTCGLELALRLVSRLGVAGATLKQHLRTLVVFLSEVEVGPSLGELGTGNGVVETDQQIAGSHRLAFTKMQGGQAPFHFRANHHDSSERSEPKVISSSRTSICRTGTTSTIGPSAATAGNAQKPSNSHGSVRNSPVMISPFFLVEAESNRLLRY